MFFVMLIGINYNVDCTTFYVDRACTNDSYIFYMQRVK